LSPPIEDFGAVGTGLKCPPSDYGKSISRKKEKCSKYDSGAPPVADDL